MSRRHRAQVVASGSLFRVSGVFFAAAAVSLLVSTASTADRQAAPAIVAEDENPRIGRLLRIPGTITDRTERRVRQAVEQMIGQTKYRADDADAWGVLVLEIEPGPCDFGKALDLARFLSSPKLTGITTVAYLPQTLTGHAVLVAIACDEIVMHPDAQIGNAGADEETIGPAVRNAYVEIARGRRTVPVDLVIGILDPAAEVLEVETEISREFVLKSEFDKLREQKAVGEPRTLIAAGEPGMFTGRQARELGMVGYLAADRAALARALGLAASSLEDDPSLGSKWRPIRVDLRGAITRRSAEQVVQLIERQMRDGGVNFVCLWIDSPGGSTEASYHLANRLADLDPGQVRVVAYIPQQARADAALVAIACDQLVMHPDAVLGGPGAAQIPAAEVESYATAAAELARRRHHSPALAAALIDPNLEVYRYTRRSDAVVDYFTAEEAAAMEDAKNWQRGEAVTKPGRPLELTGDEAERMRLARAVVTHFEEFKKLYGLENEPAMMQPGWADYLIDALRSPQVAWVLLLVGCAALYLELQSPGIGVGAFGAGVCFLLYFWASYLGGTAGWLEVLLFLSGVTCLVIEIFLLPGFGVFGIGGGLLVISSLVLASQTFIVPHNEYQLAQLRNSLLVVTGAGAGFIVGSIFLKHVLHRTPGLNRIMLAPPDGEELATITRRESLGSFEHLVGQRGQAATRLCPSGKARFGGELVDVVSDGAMIQPGAEVVVAEVHGHRVVVRMAET